MKRLIKQWFKYILIFVLMLILLAFGCITGMTGVLSVLCLVAPVFPNYFILPSSCSVSLLACYALCELLDKLG